MGVPIQVWLPILVVAAVILWLLSRWADPLFLFFMRIKRGSCGTPIKGSEVECDTHPPESVRTQE